jgi:hypothetical protein
MTSLAIINICSTFSNTINFTEALQLPVVMKNTVSPFPRAANLAFPDGEGEVSGG